ncbi:hypothetical protein, partial [Klebsiella pneumoniae]
NSLLEALAFAGWIADGLDTGPTAEILPETSEPRRVGDLAAIRAIMERDVGVVRDADGLARAAEALHALSLSGCPAALVGHLVARAA